MERGRFTYREIGDELNWFFFDTTNIQKQFENTGFIENKLWVGKR